MFVFSESSTGVAVTIRCLRNDAISVFPTCIEEVVIDFSAIEFIIESRVSSTKVIPDKSSEKSIAKWSLAALFTSNNSF